MECRIGVTNCSCLGSGYLLEGNDKRTMAKSTRLGIQPLFGDEPASSHYPPPPPPPRENAGSSPNSVWISLLDGGEFNYDYMPNTMIMAFRTWVLLSSASSAGRLVKRPRGYLGPLFFIRLFGWVLEEVLLLCISLFLCLCCFYKQFVNYIYRRPVLVPALKVYSVFIS